MAGTQGDDDASSLLDAIVEGQLSDWLKKTEVERAIVATIAEETRVPPIAVRIVYHWGLVLAVEKAENALKDKIGAAANEVRKRLAHLARAPVFNQVFPALERVYRKAQDARFREDLLRQFLTQEGIRGSDDLEAEALKERVQLAQLEADRDFREDARELLSLIIEVLQRQPPLDLKAAPAKAENRMAHGCKEFCNRAVVDFLDHRALSDLFGAKLDEVEQATFWGSALDLGDRAGACRR